MKTQFGLKKHQEIKTRKKFQFKKQKKKNIKEEYQNTKTATTNIN